MLLGLMPQVLCDKTVPKHSGSAVLNLIHSCKLPFRFTFSDSQVRAHLPLGSTERLQPGGLQFRAESFAHTSATWSLSKETKPQ